MRRALPLLILCACQEYNIKTSVDEPDAPVDTDPGLPLDQPDIVVTPMQLSFGGQPVDCPSDPQTVTIENVGTGTLVVDPLDLIGVGTEAFTLSDSGPYTLQPGEAVEVDVTFLATSYTLYDQVRLRVKSNDPDEGTVRVSVKGEGSEAPYKEELFIQSQASEVDVLWVIDTSSSMSDIVTQLGNAMGVFIQSFVNLDLDYQMAVTTTDMTSAGLQGAIAGPIITPNTANPVAAFQLQVDQGIAGSTDEKGYAAARAALSAPLIHNANAGLMRPDATLAVVIVSDEDDADANPFINAGNNQVTDTFVTFLQGLKPNVDHVSFSGLVGARNANLSSCASKAPQYHRAFGATGGVWGDICSPQQGLQPFLTFLSFVAAGLEYRFELETPPLSPGPSTIDVDVNGVPVPYDPIHGWTWDTDNQAVRMNGDSIPEPGETVLIRYYYESDCTP